MTSKQQVKELYSSCKVIRAYGFFSIQVLVNDELFIIGYAHSEYAAFTNAMKNLGLRTISGRGLYMKDLLKRIKEKQ